MEGTWKGKEESKEGGWKKQGRRGRGGGRFNLGRGRTKGIEAKLFVGRVRCV